jgi:hypothetical protein
MTTESPIACSLDADELKQRLAEISTVGGAALRDVQSMPSQAILRFAAGDETRQRLAAILAAEARCCAFMTFELRDEADAIVMTISAPEGAELVLDDLVAAFNGEVRA